MITKLTKAQEDMIEVYRKKYLQIGLCTEPMDQEKAIVFADVLYEKILSRQKPHATICMPSPLSAWFATVLLQYCHQENVPQEKVDEAIKKMRKKHAVDEAVCDVIKKDLWEDVKQTTKHFIWPYIDGQFSVAFFAFYDYVREVLEIKFEHELYDVYREVLNYGPIYPLDRYCIVSDRPKAIHINAQERLHKDGGPAMEYSDFKVYALNGVRVPDWLALTPGEKISGKKILEIDNAEVRREAVRKIGIEKVCSDCGAKVLDKEEMYELLELDVDGDKPKYLKMRNPSIGTYHVEGVPPSCLTVQDAIDSRMPEELRNLPVDPINGGDWQQQGDVIVWDKKMKTRKPRPSVLT